MKRWSVAAALLAACLTGCTGETTATVNPQTQALERAEQAGLLREEEKKPQLLSVYEAQKLAGEQFDSESYAVAPSRETLECEVEGETIRLPCSTSAAARTAARSDRWPWTA